MASHSQHAHSDLLSQPLGTKILSISDEWFAEASNLTTPTPPIRRPGVFTHAGAWYDGWETRRHNPKPFDYVIFRLGVSSGKVLGVEVDTAFFDGNHAPEIAVQGACLEPGEEADERVKREDFDGWISVLGRKACGPSRRQAWLLDEGSREMAYSHVRLQMFPDGGIARFRLYGSVVPVLPQSVDEVFDLAATVNGGVAVACSDQHFGRIENLLLPGRGKDMGDGWETKRSRGVHIDWVIVRLGAEGVITKLVVDTAHFRGNFPQKVQIFAAKWIEDGAAPAHDDFEAWTEILAPSKLGPDAEHEFEKGSGLENGEADEWAFVKMVIIPDGGVKRLRVFGKRGRSHLSRG